MRNTPYHNLFIMGTSQLIILDLTIFPVEELVMATLSPMSKAS